LAKGKAEVIHGIGVQDSLVAKGDDRIDPCGTSRWDEAGRYRDCPEQESGSGKQSGAVRRNLVELGSEESAQGKCGPEAEEQPDHDRLHPLRNDKPQNVARLRAECHAQANLPSPLFDRVGDRAVNPNKSEKKSEKREGTEQAHREALLA